MSSPEHGGFPEEQHAGELEPGQLPPQLAEFLRGQEVACLLHETNRGTAFVIKLPAREIGSLRGTMPVGVRHELYAHRAAPVIRTVLTLYDQPQTPLALESYTNVEDAGQRADFAALAHQEALLLLFHDETLIHRLTKLVPHRDHDTITAIITHADALRAAIRPDAYDFGRAKADVITGTSL